MNTLAKSVAVLLTAAAITGAGAGVASAATPTPPASPTIDVTATDSAGGSAVAHYALPQIDGAEVDCLEHNGLALYAKAGRGQPGDLTFDFSIADPVHLVVSEAGRTLYDAVVPMGTPPVVVPIPAQS
ncbi:hypothetical protein [Pseudonocardia sp.]|jgi:hypothetical protein|uniref:hypothetical protein n=1 Tax=Pseudonocardia sp. TaxID=60912 RepID=UPI003D0EB4B7